MAVSMIVEYNNMDKFMVAVIKERIGLIVCIVMMMQLLSLPVSADDSENDLPAGIATCSDQAVVTAYKYGITERKWLAEYNQASEVVATWIFSGKKGVQGLPQISENTPYEEPCYYFTAAKLGLMNLTPRTKEVLEKNQALGYFKSGIAKYFSRWITRDYGGSSVSGTERAIAVNFHKSLLAITKSTSLDYTRFRSANKRKQKEYFWVNYQHLIKNDEANPRLIAQWSIVFLADHYKKSGLDTEYQVAKEYLIDKLVIFGEDLVKEGSVNRYALLDADGSIDSYEF